MGFLFFFFFSFLLIYDFDFYPAHIFRQFSIVYGQRAVCKVACCDCDMCRVGMKLSESRVEVCPSSVKPQLNPHMITEATEFSYSRAVNQTGNYARRNSFYSCKGREQYGMFRAIACLRACDMRSGIEDGREIFCRYVIMHKHTQALCNSCRVGFSFAGAICEPDQTRIAKIDIVRVSEIFSYVRSVLIFCRLLLTAANFYNLPIISFRNYFLH